MRLTETKVYKRDAVIQRIAVGINTYPKYFKEQDNYTIINKDASILNNVFLLYRIFKASNTTSFNKQLQVINLSKSQWLLRLIGVLDSNRNVHPIADPNMTKYAKFRQYLHRFVFGDNITQDNKMGLILITNIVITDLAKKADIIFITPNIVLQTYVYSISAAHAVFYNEAGKVSELGSLVKFTWSRLYLIQGGL